MNITIKNEYAAVTCQTFGAELLSYQTAEGKEYLWQKDPAYWAKTSPVLFPYIGPVMQAVVIGEKAYDMPRHGFVKDAEFVVAEQGADYVVLSIAATETTKAVFPYDFLFTVTFRLTGPKLSAVYGVVNKSQEEMPFLIGGHPAFLCPINNRGVQTEYKLLFDEKDKITSGIIGNGGTLSARTKDFILQDGMMDITADLFDEDALIIEHDQAHSVALCDSERHPYLTVRFDAPLFGIWSPAKINAPFICIEPWYGRCDREAFCGDLSEREWGNTLAAGEVFAAEYTIII